MVLFLEMSSLEECAPTLVEVQNPLRFFYTFTQYFSIYHFDLRYVGHLLHGWQLKRHKTKMHTRVNKFCNQNCSENPNTQIYP